MKIRKKENSKKVVIKLTSLFLAFVLICLSGVSINIKVSAVQGDFVINSDGELTEYNGDDEIVVIPDNVKSIGPNAFWYNSNIKEIQIHKNVTSVWSIAFLNCENLKAINVDSDNPNYSSVDGVFFNKDKTILFKFPGNMDCERYLVPSTVISIGDIAFAHCKNLKELTISKNVTEFGSNVFWDCVSFKAINVDSNNQNYSSVDGIIFNKDKTVLLKFPAQKDVKEYTVFNSVTKIEINAFANCVNLTNIDIPASVIEIGWFAFGKCYALKAVNVDNENLNYSSVDGVLLDKNKTILKAFPGGKDGEYTVSDSVIEVEKDAFNGCDNLTKVVMPQSVKKIGDNAFSDCTNLKEIIIFGIEVERGGDIFRKCPNLVIKCYRGADIYYYADMYDIPCKFINIKNFESKIVSNESIEKIVTTEKGFEVTPKKDIIAMQIELNVPEDVVYEIFTDIILNRNLTKEVTLNEKITKVYAKYVKNGVTFIDEISIIKDTPTKEFEDVDTWAEKYVNITKDLGIVGGKSEGKLAGSDFATRQEAATFIMRYMGVDISQYLNDNDIYADSEDISSYAKGYIKAAYSMRIMAGTKADNKLYIYPKENITRAQMFALVARTYRLTNEIDTKKIEDFDIAFFKDYEELKKGSLSWFEKDAKLLGAYEIVKGDSGYFNFNKNITRNEILTALARIINPDIDK